MNKHWQSLTILALFLVVMSCSNDSYLTPIFDDSMIDWKESMSDIMGDNKDNLENRGFVLKDMEFLTDVKLDSSLFYSGDYCYYPVFSKKDSVIEVLKFDDLQHLEGGHSLKTEAIKSKISQLMTDKDKYDVIRLTWMYNGKVFPTLALFNRLTCELEYDNMLFNLTTLSRLDTNEMVQLLNRSENQMEVDSGGDAVYYYENGSSVASASVHWSAIGHWNPVVYDPHPNKNVNDTIIDHWIYYIYRHERVITSKSTWAASSAYGSFADIIEITTPIPNPSYYSVKYALWAGPKGGFDNGNWNILIVNEINMNNRISSGEGFMKAKTIYPYREPTYGY